MTDSDCGRSPRHILTNMLRAAKSGCYPMLPAKCRPNCSLSQCGDAASARGRGCGQAARGAVLAPAVRGGRRRHSCSVGTADATTKDRRPAPQAPALLQPWHRGADPGPGVYDPKSGKLFVQEAVSFGHVRYSVGGRCCSSPAAKLTTEALSAKPSRSIFASVGWSR